MVVAVAAAAVEGEEAALVSGNLAGLDARRAAVAVADNLSITFCGWVGALLLPPPAAETRPEALPGSTSDLWVSRARLEIFGGPPPR